ncbi:plakophilin-2 [Mugil cephalus]|uniref:plakophilin-2 n=1 Tax=Mugil cephalus TaxID=48193 RepID=UPI001FB73F75|nr:plakophilin-2 [Mugil cephalus]
MDEVFLKSALPAQSSFVLDDTSLALPAEPTLGSATRLDSNERSQRVHQQVQLTLARRAKRSQSNGGFHLQKTTARSFDAVDGFLSNTRVNGFSNSSLPNRYMGTASRRVEVSPPPSPEIPRTRFYSTYHYGMNTIPASGPSTTASTLPYRSHVSDSRRGYIFSEMPRRTQRSLRQTPGTQSMFGSSGFRQNGGYGSQWTHSGDIIWDDVNNVQGHNGDMMRGPVQPEGGFSWLAHGRMGQRSFRLNSYPPSVGIMDGDMGKKMEVELPVQQMQTQNIMTAASEKPPPEMTLERAVFLLGKDNEETLVNAASFIQSKCFQKAGAKNMVYNLHGIEKLLQLLNHDSEEVQHVVAGALRNVVYQSSENKMEVKNNDGVALILQALQSSRDTETRRQLTGILWNLSSHDLLKDHLSRESLNVLTKSVLVPCSGIGEGENPKDELLADIEVFHNATGCLRNLSSAGPDVRKEMRECDNLIDSLVYYVRGTVADYKADDKSTENCVCILHNLSYQIESELPPHYTCTEPQPNSAPSPPVFGCFSYRAAEIPEDLDRPRPLLEEKANPLGVEWLWNPITIRMYLSLIACSERHHTQETAIGALQNITAGNGPLSQALAFIIVEREKGLLHIQKILEDGESGAKRTAISLIRNLSRYQELLPFIGDEVLTGLVNMLPGDDPDTELPSDVTISLLRILISLSQSDAKHVKTILNQGAHPKIVKISLTYNGYGPSRAAQTACVLLHEMWKHGDLNGALKKGRFKKSDFINARTTKIVNTKRAEDP